MMFFALLSLLAVAATALQYEDGEEYSVRCTSSQTGCELIKGRSQGSHAYGTYSDEITKDGWGKIWVHADATDDGWYQAGFLEGALTAQRIYQHYTSWYAYQFPTPPANATLQFLYDQMDYAKNLAQSKRGDDEYYDTLAKVLAQFQGILDGQNAAAASGEKLSFTDLLLLEAAGDLYEIIPATVPAAFKLRVGAVSREAFFDLWHEQISCSALIKIADDRSDVFAAHTTWTSYQNMLRVYKNYDMDGGRYKSSHSSKPGVIYSKDDFYVLPNQKLVVMETTNGVMNQAVYKFVVPNTLLVWQRVPLSNTLATTAPDWAGLMSRHDSGTYANQWMALDMKRFVPGVGGAAEGFLVILELMPGMIRAHDVSGVLAAQSYWPSYNIPYDRDIYAWAGFQQAFETYGDQYSYANCSRAQIFARDESKVQSFSSMQRMLRYNDYLNDPISQDNPAYAISARYDLRSSSAKTYGGVDTKATSFQRVMQKDSLQAYASAECGPTHNDLPPFQWSTSGFDAQVHLGQPDLFNFSFVDINYAQH
ncbi:MAG: hypothetical protein EOO65_00010 [Methanosarcinales archaeon]|nr:MAG: hypothetical protein EOO65_00010 [Methanosarcinales archaeon]